ncbi:MAG TPA: hypothetical protein VE465_13985 [Streptosporangiaceae bacterium]|nr:hypothetical protein [Streptosporangiaceae bacterium]
MRASLDTAQMLDSMDNDPQAEQPASAPPSLVGCCPICTADYVPDLPHVCYGWR